MKIRKNADLFQFLQKARECGGEVIYTTSDGDRLDLKSLLATFVFMSAVKLPPAFGGDVICSVPADYESLADYLEG